MEYILINSKYDNHKIDKNEFIFINTNNIILHENNNTQVLILEYTNFIKQILNSYKDEIDLINQFKLDFYRTCVFINGFQLTSHEYFINFFNKLLPNNKLNELLSICSQTGLSEAYIIVQKTLFNKNNNLIFSELIDKKKTRHKIKIKTYNNQISINILKKLRIVDPTNEISQNLYNVDINLNLIFNIDEYVTITYNMEHIKI